MILCKPQKVFIPARLSRDSVTYGAITACRLCHARLKERADPFPSKSLHTSKPFKRH